MLVIKPLLPGEPLPREIDARTLCGDTVSVQVTRSGFALSYMPTGTAQWRSFPYSEYAEEILAGIIPDSFILGAEQDGILVGILAARYCRSRWCEIHDLRIDTSCRMQGIGRTLLDACMRNAVRRDMEGLRIVVSDTNPAMCQFAQHCGFKLEGIDRLAYAMSPEERHKPMIRRASALIVYRQTERDS